MLEFELLSAQPPPQDFANREIFAFYTTFRNGSLIFLGQFEGLQGRLICHQSHEELVGGQPESLAARIYLVPKKGNKFWVDQLQIQYQTSEPNKTNWTWLVRDSECLAHRLWGTLKMSKEAL